MHIQEWSVFWNKVINDHYPRKMSPEERLLAVYRQLADVSREIAKNKGFPVDEDSPQGEVKLRVAATFIDLFVLCEDLKVDLEAEFEKVNKWFKNRALQQKV